jgi:4-aminobutyrate--pyruvate transaminase
LTGLRVEHAGREAAEPVMAGAGVIPPPATYFAKVQAILRKYDIVTIADEVVCGFGRTGNMFGSETVGMVPDTMTVAKQLSSAYLPVAAVLIPEWMYDVLVSESSRLGVFGHGITYGGHPVPAAVALRALELFDERNMLSHIRRVSSRFQARLRSFAAHPLVGDVRGVGLIGAVELVRDKRSRQAFDASQGVGAYCAEACIRHGLINRANGDNLLFCPPQIIEETEIDQMFDRFERALGETEKWLHGGRA